MVAKKPKYEPIGDILSAETAFIQASAALDIAGQFAVESRDADQLRLVAEQYSKLGSYLMNPGPGEEEEEEEHDLTPTGFGFVTGLPEKEATNGRTDGDDGDEAEAQGRRVSWIYTKHGKL